jgi:DNA-binding winged helix-turn-helix (wHTH) protein
MGAPLIPSSLRPASGDVGLLGLRFGSFEVDLASGELRKGGTPVKLQAQPFKVLTLLARRSGELLTREEIAQEVWPDSSADIEQALNFCIRQIRAALGDNANAPRYVETLPRRGYRFVAPVEPIRSGPLSSPTKPSLQPAEPPPAADRRLSRSRVRLSSLLLPALVGALLAGLGSSLYFLSRHAQPIPSFQRITFRRGLIGAARFGPGEDVLYTANWEGRGMRLYSVQLESLESRLMGGEGPEILGVAPNEEVALLRSSGTLARGLLRGGPLKDVLEDVLAADWGRDGESFAVARAVEGSHARIEFPIGHVLCEALRPTHLRVAPGGERLAFIEHPKWADDRGSVVVVDRSGHRTTLSGPWGSAAGLAWTPDGKEVWFTAAHLGFDSALYAVDLAGGLRTLTPAVGRFVIHDIAADGRVLLERKSIRSEIRYGHPGESEEKDLSWLDHSRVVRLTPDGGRLLFIESGEAGGPEYRIYLRDTTGSMPVRVGHGWAQDLSADGAQVLSIPVQQLDRLDVIPTGAGLEQHLQDPGIVEYEWAGFLPQGGGIVFAGRSSDASSRMYLRRPGEAPRPLTPRGSVVHWNTISPDGERLIAPCAAGACLYPLAGDDKQPVPGLADARAVLGWADDQTLFVRDEEAAPMRVSRLRITDGRRTPWAELGPSDVSGVQRISATSVVAAGRAYAYSFTRQTGDLYVVEGLE